MTSPTGTFVLPPARGDCTTGKVQFVSRKQARSWRKKTGTGPVGAYRCGMCGFWHLGHQPQRVRNGSIDKVAWLRATGQGSK